MKYDHLHGLLVPVMFISEAKLVANALFEHCDGFFGAAMKAKGIGVKGGSEVCVIRSIGTHEIQKDQLLLFWVSQIAIGKALTNFHCSLELIGYRRCHELIDGVSRRTVQINYGEIAVAYILIYSIYHQEAERHHDANWYTCESLLCC